MVGPASPVADVFAGLYGQEQDLFDREYLTENEFRALFVHDDNALNRMGVRSVEEVACLIRRIFVPYLLS